jgi:endonuclease YncB( thermonuclease family)
MTKILTRFFILASFFTVLVLLPYKSLMAQDRLPQGDFTDLKDVSVRVVTEVLDPLTLRLDDESTIHLTGLDYPDWDPYEPGPISLTGMTILKDLLRNQKVIVYQTKKKGVGRLNRMGQNLAHIVRKKDKSWVQGTMLMLGIARVRTTQGNPEMAKHMYALESVARNERIGLWRTDAYTVIPADKADLLIGGFGIVEGTILKTAMKSNRLYLNFGQNWRKDFTVSISSQDRRNFHKAGIDPMQWNGQKVRVRGWVSSYNGPYIEIDHPARIELLSRPSDQTAEKTDEKEDASDMIDQPEEKQNKQGKKGHSQPVYNDG